MTIRSYDGLDRLESETRYDGKVVAYGYDAKGNRTSVTDPDSVVTSYAFDPLDRLETATVASATTRYAYWPDGLLSHTTLPNGVEEGRCYDAAGRLGALITARGTVNTTCTTGGTTLSRYGYSYDANGNRLTQQEQRTNPATQALGAAETTLYAYDVLDRLAGVAYADNRVVLYNLDAVGNRIGEREIQVGGTSGVVLASWGSPPAGMVLRDVTGTFNRADWLLSRTDAVDGMRSVAFGYDLNGNQVSKTKAGLSRTLAWDARNTLTAVYDNGVEAGRYDYDHNLQRVKRRTGTENVEYVLDDRFVLQETNGAIQEHPAYRRYHYAHEPLAVSDSAGMTYLSVDALGSVGDQTSATGTVTAARQYDAWGQYRNGTAPGADQPKLGYTGHQFDPETGLVYARARYYDAECGLFLSRDALERSPADAPSLHRFAWARGNPLRFLDPSGFAEEEVQPEPVKAPTLIDESEGQAPVCLSNRDPCPESPARAAARQKRDEEDKQEREKRAAARARIEAKEKCRRRGECPAEEVVTEAGDGPSTESANEDAPENDDPGVRDVMRMRAHRFDKTREYAKKTEAVLEAGIVLLPGLGQAYDLKLTKEEAEAGNWTPALFRAGIVLGPNAIRVAWKIGGKWVWKLVKAGSAEGKVAAKIEQVAAGEVRLLGEAANRAEHEAYKDALRAAMDKPHVVDAELASLLGELYRPGATVGSGSTAAAVRVELSTGAAVGGKMHAEKAQGYIRALERWLQKNPAARPGDRAAAENVIRDMTNALGGR